MSIEHLPIGFEGILTRSKPNLIGFEQFEDENYSKVDSMPNPTASYSNELIPSKTSSTKRRVSFEQLFATYNEIQTVWFQEEWLCFTNHDTRTYLTLNCRDYDHLTLQMAIDKRLLTTENQLLLYQPECLILRTKSKTKTFVLPNVRLSITTLCDPQAIRSFSSYRLMAIICHSDQSNSQVMFYKHFPTNLWYVFYDQSIHCYSHSNLLSDSEQNQFEEFLNSHSRKLTSLPLSLIHNHPTIFVYLGERSTKH